MTESNLRGFRGLTLDAFGALLPGGPAHVPTALDRIVREHRFDLDSGALRDLWSAAMRTHRESEPFLAFREVHRRSFQEVFDRLEIPGAVDEPVEETFTEYRRATVYAEVPPVLRELEREVPIAVVSNMDTKPLLEVLQNNGLGFTFVITSEEEQRYKPAPPMFRRAVRYLGLPAAHVLHVGDSYEEDVIGATSAGMGSLLMRRDGLPADVKGRTTGIVRDLAEVRDFLRCSWKE